MVSTKMLFIAALMTVLVAQSSAELLDHIFPTIMTQFYNNVTTKQGYRYNLEEPNGSKREEVGVIMNPGTPEEQLVVVGTHSNYDEKTDTDTVTTYTADKDGYKARYEIKNRKLSAGALKSAAG